MEEEIQPSKQYLQAFNNGYILNENDPKLLESMLKSNQSDNDYFQGLRDGMQQSEKEKIKQQIEQQNGQQQERKRKI